MLKVLDLDWACANDSIKSCVDISLDCPVVSSFNGFIKGRGVIDPGGSAPQLITAGLTWASLEMKDRACTWTRHRLCTSASQGVSAFHHNTPCTGDKFWLCFLRWPKRHLFFSAIANGCSFQLCGPVILVFFALPPSSLGLLLSLLGCSTEASYAHRLHRLPPPRRLSVQSCKRVDKHWTRGPDMLTGIFFRFWLGRWAFHLCPLAYPSPRLHLVVQRWEMRGLPLAFSFLEDE